MRIDEKRAIPYTYGMARTKLVTIKVTAEERERWISFAQSQGTYLGTMIREYIEAKIKREQRKEPAE